MNRFIIVDDLPYLYARGKAYAVRWDENGFTVGDEVKLDFTPKYTLSELSIKAKCPVLDSIGAVNQSKLTEPKKASRSRKKATE